MMNEIQTYYRQLDDLRRIAGADDESGLRAAFETLLRTVGQAHQLILRAEYSFKARNGATLRADGVLIDRLRLVHGWWEAKDEKDDLEKEIATKLAKGYPSDNIIFEDTRAGVLLQQGQEVFRCNLDDAGQLRILLDRFFAYELPEVQNFRVARAKFLTELPQVALALSELLATAHHDHSRFQQRAAEFLQLCQRSIGERVTTQHVDEMLIQHLLTDQIFRAVFPQSHFHQENHLARAIGELENCFFLGEIRRNLLKRLEPYFAAIRQAAANTVTSAEKQDFLKQVYEDFYSAYNPKDADRLGVVYTPQEAVRFIIEGCDWLTQQHFNKRLLDSGLEILDPCTGTGTFIVDLLEYWRGDQRALVSKFMNEVHANEISILPYYIACLNIEQSFYEITDQWREFGGLCFVNTLENWGFQQTHEGAHQDLFGSVTDENHARIQAQNARKIPVILGNPPYNAKQLNYNFQNPNQVYQDIDKRIKETYIHEGSAQNQIVIYDMYVRFFRWASDRIGEKGVLGFVTNRSYLDSRSFDGFRKVITQEFQEIWIVDLMSDVRKNPKISGTKHNIFGIQTGVAIAFFVRNPQMANCEIHYLSLDDFLPAIEKRRWLKSHHLHVLAKTGQFRLISPNAQGLWLNQPTENWTDYLPIASKEVKAGKSEQAIFKVFANGLETGRDEWLYDFSIKNLTNKVLFFVDIYNKNLYEEEFDLLIKWNSSLKSHKQSKKSMSYDQDLIRSNLYRPFFKLYHYAGKTLNHRLTDNHYDYFGKNLNKDNIAIAYSGVSFNQPFHALATKYLTERHFVEKSQCLPLYRYENSEKFENITDWALKQFQEHYQNLAGFKNLPGLTLTKRDIFNYVYAVLHDPRYREKFALNLKQEFPRIPFYSQFWKWANIGKQLIELHIHFEQVEPYPLTRVEIKAKTNKVRLKADKSENLIEIDNETQLKDIPASAWQYQLGNRSALEWILDQYKEKTPKDLTIREKFNTYCFADHKETVIELLKKVCRVSVETMNLIAQIEKLGSPP